MSPFGLTKPSRRSPASAAGTFVSSLRALRTFLSALCQPPHGYLGGSTLSLTEPYQGSLEMSTFPLTRPGPCRSATPPRVRAYPALPTQPWGIDLTPSPARSRRSCLFSALPRLSARQPGTSTLSLFLPPVCQPALPRRVLGPFPAALELCSSPFLSPPPGPLQ